MEAEFHDYEKNEKWRKIFRNMNSMSKSLPCKESRKVENKLLNRYLDVVPYDNTRVKLERYGINYINASHVYYPPANRKYILTQGPLLNTCGHFWLMVWEQKSRAILMLNNLIESGSIKCCKYWPDGDISGYNDAHFIVFEDVSLKVELISYEKFNSYILRKFILYDLLSETSREILHFHYTSWPDFDLPRSSDSFLEFLNAVRNSGCLDIEKHGPTVIHCSAGIGRSGTFILVDTCLVMIEKNNCRDSINIIDTLQELRLSRMGLIQTADQLRFSFMAILEGSKHIVKLNNENTSLSPQKQNNTNTNTTTPTKIRRSFGLVDKERDKQYFDEIQGSSTDTKSNINDEEETLDDDYNEIIFEQIISANENDPIKNEDRAIEPSSPSPPATNNQEDAKNIRQRKKEEEREERKRKTMDLINNIKRKQKEQEERYPSSPKRHGKKKRKSI